MKYMGSKSRIAKHILPIMLNDAKNNNINSWVEPFVGGANTIDKVPNTFIREGSDSNPHTIQALITIRDYSDKLPENVTEEQYKSYKGLEPNIISSWVRFAISFGGIFESKLASDKTGNRNYTQEAVRNAKKQSPNLQGVRLTHQSYESIELTSKCLIYCDPPYQNTSGYKTGAFDSNKFFNWCRQKAKEGHIVYVSEYNAPNDFECVWQGEIKTNFSSTRKEATHIATEKLYKVRCI